MGKTEQLREKLGPLRVAENEPLSKHTYFRIGGPARYFFEANSPEDLILALKTAHDLQIPHVVLGGGANVLVSDKGFYGLVIKNRTTGIKVVGFKGSIDKTGSSLKSALVWVASGTAMNQLARFTIDQGFEGLDFLLSVPGTVGGGLKINSHYQVEKSEYIGNRLVSANLYNPKTGETKEVQNDYFEFSYDYSKIQDTGEIVLDAIFKVHSAKDKQALWQSAMEGVKLRNEEQPIGIACSGCVFQNITQSDAIRLSTPNGTTSTGFIIDSLGLKGVKIGGAEISAKHANYILNNGGATAKDVYDLIEMVKEKAKETYGLDLKEEIFYVGSF